ncbi:tripartite tricarboxylate transporter substrate binding protein [Reyranella sp.]|jgi:tripartite-type tricarboxylate transporter receptor subunit TctC|uniref:Bug family tripartite tricarboxylate transporter substrate binding protein n=1 Tax=Reyranella sp. TaxID=1929291 RepID=UPI002715E3FB|nr:tripartite tricarboxylate transporter substrate binding protein [Reyranella sp.]MDO8972516.1 tripartite tricarboxylate transporter substrate binding protein [Reyranella sp.]MDP3239200.1 tripartite tricarboxylate transporter substrate binding protein [Reyranella sp.]
MIGRRQFGMGLGAAAFAAPAIVQAQKYPAGRVTMVVPFPAGAATDISARIYAERLSALWGQPVVIDNKGGGNGIPAAESVARARPDGLTLFATSAMTQVVNPAIYDKLPYDPIADFAPISRMGTSPFVLLVDRNSPINSAAELTAKLKAEPGKHNYGAGALPARVASELYKMAAGVDAVYVGYKSNPQAIPDVQSGLLTFMMIDTVNAKIAMDRGALKGLFVTDRERYAAVPDMPTAAEAGLPEVLLTTWTGFYAPKGTPAEIVDRINADLYTVAAMPEVVERLAALGGTPKLMRPAEFAAFASAEKERWGQIIRRANIKVE